MHSFLRYFIVTVWVVACVEATIPEGPCFLFQGNAYVYFTPNNFINRDEMLYRFQFSTQQANGILMFAVGADGDVEALYIRDGYLRYHLFNPAPSGIENSYGGYFMIPQEVNIDDWVTVYVYRNWHMTNAQQQRDYNQTGIVATINGQNFTHVDERTLHGINLSSTLYFGGYKDRLSRTVHLFEGMMRNMSEKKNNVTFETPSLNYRSRVTTC